jgi:hypothetical protein
MTSQSATPLASLRFRRALAVLLLLLGSGVQGVGAQDTSARVIGPGTEVRVGLAAEPNLLPHPRRVEWARGTIHDIQPDTLFLSSEAAGLIPIPRLMITDVRESLGIDRWQSGRDVGFSLAVFAALVMSVIQETELADRGLLRSEVGAYATAAAGGFAVGFAIGGIRPFERWRTAWLPE